MELFESVPAYFMAILPQINQSEKHSVFFLIEINHVLVFNSKITAI